MIFKFFKQQLGCFFFLCGMYFSCPIIRIQWHSIFQKEYESVSEEHIQRNRWGTAPHCHASESQRITIGSRFPLPTMWVLEIELMWLCLVWPLYLLSYLTNPDKIDFIELIQMSYVFYCVLFCP